MVIFSSHHSEVFIYILFNLIMVFYSFEMILVGIILLSGMAAGGIKLWLKKRHESLEQLDRKTVPKQQNLDSSKNNL